MHYLFGAWGDRLAGTVSTWKILEASWMQLSTTHVHHVLAAWARASPVHLAGAGDAGSLRPGEEVAWLWHQDPLWSVAREGREKLGDQEKGG